VFTDTDCELCTAITRVIGDEFGLIGTCGGAIITTDVLGGSGLAATSVLAVTSTGGDNFNAGPVLAGSTSEAIGACTAATHTTIACMGVPSGCGVDTVVLVCISTVAALSTAITRDAGAESALTGICGGADITTSHDVGSGEGTVASVDTCTDCEF